MRPSRYSFGLLAVAALALFAGCGFQGNPLPPSLELPQPVGDLKAARKGDKVLLTWTAPRETTDKLRIKEAGTTRVCRATTPPAAMECSQVSEVAARPAPGAPASFTDLLPRDLQEQTPTSFAVYTVEAMNARGRSAGLSNPVRVPLVHTLPPPADLKVAITADAIVVSFTPVAPSAPSALFTVYRIYRHAKGAASQAVAGEVPVSFPGPLTFADKGFQWETTYEYRVAGVTQVSSEGARAEVEGEDSAVAEVLAHDSFPPAASTGVQAVASSSGGQSFVDLTWTPNAEADLAGYQVYRREASEPPQRINSELVKTPAFRDANVSPGHTYLYSVSAVDLRSNESERSEENSESVPQP